MIEICWIIEDPQIDAVSYYQDFTVCEVYLSEFILSFYLTDKIFLGNLMVIEICRYLVCLIFFFFFFFVIVINYFFKSQCQK